jgi:ammonia channel protein AmtB
VLLRGVGADPNADYAGTIPHLTFMVYQLMFAIITPALITGATAERMKFSGTRGLHDVVVALRVLRRWRTWCGARAGC